MMDTPLCIIFCQKNDLGKNKEYLERMILLSQQSIFPNGSLYDCYLTINVNVLDESILRVLKEKLSLK